MSFRSGCVTISQKQIEADEMAGCVKVLDLQKLETLTSTPYNPRKSWIYNPSTPTVTWEVETEDPLEACGPAGLTYIVEKQRNPVSNQTHKVVFGFPCLMVSSNSQDHPQTHTNNANNNTSLSSVVRSQDQQHKHHFITINVHFWCSSLTCD